MKNTGSKAWKPALPAALVLIVLLAFALRVMRLGNQSVWYDEGMSYYFAHMGVVDLWRQARQDNHPPLYFLMLHFWMRASGTSEFALRFPSMAFSLLSVIATYALGKRVCGVKAAVAGTVLVAIAPFHVWYAQEMRMYSLLTMLVVVSSYVLLRALYGGWLWWVLYALLGAVALYTHYYATLFLFAQGVYVLIVVFARIIKGRTRPARQHGYPSSWQATRPLASFAFAVAAFGVLFLPWLNTLMTRIARDQTFWHGTLGLWQLVTATGKAFAVGESYVGRLAVTSTIVFAALLVIGLVWSVAVVWRRNEGKRGKRGKGEKSPPTSAFSLSALSPQGRSLFPSLYLPIALVGPILTVYAISHDHPKFSARYLLPSLPTACLLAGATLAVLLPSLVGFRRRTKGYASLFGIRCLAAGGLLGVLALSSRGALHQYYTDGSVARDDFRAAAAYVEEHQSPNDVIFFVGGHGAAAFNYYYRGGLPEVQLPGGLILSVDHVVDADSLRTGEQALAGKNVVWLIMYQEWIADPAHLVRDSLVATAQQLVAPRVFQGLGVGGFKVLPGTHLVGGPAMRTSPRTNFGNEMELVGHELGSEVRRGETLRLILYWRAVRPMQYDYTVFAQLMCPNSNDKCGEEDKRPLNDMYTTSRWIPNQTLRDEYAIRVRPDAPPGQATLVLGVYRRDIVGLPRLPVLGPKGEWVDDKLILGSVRIGPP